jgi:hypothetical protein
MANPIAQFGSYLTENEFVFVVCTESLNILSVLQD